MGPHEDARGDPHAVPKLLQLWKEEEGIVCLCDDGWDPQYIELFCALCNRDLGGLSNADVHVRKNDRHAKDRKRFHERKKKFLSAPQLGEADERSLSVFLESVYLQNGLNETELQTRASVCERIKHELDKELPIVFILQIYGSSLSGVGLKNADLNIDIDVDMQEVTKLFPEVLDKHTFLVRLFDMIKRCSLFCDVSDTFCSHTPLVLFKDVESGIRCSLGFGHEMSWRTSSLIKLYMGMDARALQLAVIFKYWGRVCGIDDPTVGCLPAHSFALMVIHYLQQVTPPVLPVINTQVDYGKKLVCKMKESLTTIDSNQVPFWKSRNIDSISSLLIGLLRYYIVDFPLEYLVINVRQVTPLTRRYKHWSCKRIAIEDPYSHEKNAARSLSMKSTFAHIMKCLETSYFYFLGSVRPGMQSRAMRESVAEGVNTTNKEPATVVEQCAGHAEAKQHKDGRERRSEMAESPPHKQSLRKSHRASTSEATIEPGESAIAYEESGDFKADSSSSDSSDSEGRDSDAVFEVEDVGREKVSLVSPPPSVSRSVGNVDDLENDVGSELDMADGSCLQKGVAEDREKFSEFSALFNRGSSHENFGSPSSSSSCARPDAVPALKEIADDHSRTDAILNEAKQAQPIVPGACSGGRSFVFSRSVLSVRGPVPVKCSECQDEHHKTTECPLICRGRLPSLPPMTKAARKLLDLACTTVMRNSELLKQDFEIRRGIVDTLLRVLQKPFPTCRLDLFGSSVNRFGLRDSDLDICMRFKTDDPPYDLDYARMVGQVADVLRKQPNISDVHAIKTAKVPIVKFVVTEHGIGGDISLYNSLGLYNSQMMACYASIDERVRVLGYTVKHFAKVCDIGDASRGSLSSYAYVILLLHYLQRCDPPVVPVLQELHEGKRKPSFMIEGWNCWFYDNPALIRDVWKGYKMNKQSVGELWVGFLRYYVEVFDFKRQVVSIRRMNGLSKFEKGWSRYHIAIEDPFQLSHNLGSGVRLGMFLYVTQCFKHARNLFGSSQADIPEMVRVEEYFFDRAILTGNRSAPIDRLCRRCGKIGHTEKFCSKEDNRDEDHDQDYNKQADGDKGSRTGKNGMFNDAGTSDARRQKCFNCLKPGHVKRQCPQLTPSKSRAGAFSEKVVHSKSTGLPQHGGSPSTSKMQPSPAKADPRALADGAPSRARTVDSDASKQSWLKSPQQSPLPSELQISKGDIVTQVRRLSLTHESPPQLPLLSQSSQASPAQQNATAGLNALFRIPTASAMTPPQQSDPSYHQAPGPIDQALFACNQQEPYPQMFSTGPSIFPSSPAVGVATGVPSLAGLPLMSVISPVQNRSMPLQSTSLAPGLGSSYPTINHLNSSRHENSPAASMSSEFAWAQNVPGKSVGVGSASKAGLDNQHLIAGENIAHRGGHQPYQVTGAVRQLIAHEETGNLKVSGTPDLVMQPDNLKALDPIQRLLGLMATAQQPPQSKESTQQYDHKLAQYPSQQLSYQHVQPPSHSQGVHINQHILNQPPVQQLSHVPAQQISPLVEQRSRQPPLGRSDLPSTQAPFQQLDQPPVERNAQRHPIPDSVRASLSVVMQSPEQPPVTVRLHDQKQNDAASRRHRNKGKRDKQVAQSTSLTYPVKPQDGLSGEIVVPRKEPVSGNKQTNGGTGIQQNSASSHSAPHHARELAGQELLESRQHLNKRNKTSPPNQPANPPTSEQLFHHPQQPRARQPQENNPHLIASSASILPDCVRPGMDASVKDKKGRSALPDERVAGFASSTVKTKSAPVSASANQSQPPRSGKSRSEKRR